MLVQKRQDFLRKAKVDGLQILDFCAGNITNRRRWRLTSRLIPNTAYLWGQTSEILRTRVTTPYAHTTRSANISTLRPHRYGVFGVIIIVTLDRNPLVVFPGPNRKSRVYTWHVSWYTCPPNIMQTPTCGILKFLPPGIWEQWAWSQVRIPWY